MINWNPYNRLQKFYTERARKLMIINAIAITSLILSMFLIKPNYAYAIEQLDSSTTISISTPAVSGSPPAGRPYSAGNTTVLGTGLSGTMTGISLYLGGNGATDHRVAIWCWDSQAALDDFINGVTLMTNANTSCSWYGTTSDYNFDNVPDAKTLRTRSISSPFVFQSDKFYTLSIWYYTTCGTSCGLMRAYGDASGNLYYELDGVNAGSAQISALTNSPYLVGQKIKFFLEWVSIPFSPRNIFFYEDIEDNNPVFVVYNYPVGTTGNWTYEHTFDFSGPYRPMFAITNEECTAVDENGTPVGSGCEYMFSDDISIEISSQEQLAAASSFLYQSTFSASKYNDVIVDDDITFTYNLSSNFCTAIGSSVSGKRLFKGYPQALQYLDNGQVLPGSTSGSTTMAFDRTAQPYSDFYYPYILVYCANGTSHKVYLGGSILIQNAKGISVYNANDIRFSLPSAWLQGGSYTESGATYLFQSDKSVYMINEQVKLKYRFSGIDPQYTHLFLFDTGTGGTLMRTLTGSFLQQGVNHYLTITYNQPGEYTPLLVLSNSGGTVTRFVFLGGYETDESLNSWIVVQSQGSPLYTNSGGILGQFGGTGGVINTSGIFGLQFKIGWGTSGNVFLDTVQGILSPVIWAALWVAQQMYSVFSIFPVFDLMFDIINPQEDECYVIPSTLLDFPGNGSDIPMPETFIGREFCIELTDHSNAKMFTVLLRFFIISVLIMTFLKTFLPSR